MIITMLVGALDGLRSLTFGSPENFWEVAGHHKRTSATQNERLGTVGGSTRSISDRRNSRMDPFATIWKSLIRPLYSPEIVQGCAMRVSWLVSVVWSVVRWSEQS